MRTLKTLSASILVLGLVACENATAPETPDVEEVIVQTVTKDDKFTYSNYDEIQMTHLDLNLDVDFDRKVLDGVATIDFVKLDPAVKELVLDTKDLTINSIQQREDGAWKDAAYALSEPDAMMGTKLTILLLDKADQIRIDYETSPTAEGLQWLSPEQTAGKKHPYLFSQGQAINARTMAPVQDTPAVRITYSATLRTPPELVALMSADQDPYTPRDGEYTFDMPQPVPAYLLAFAVGDIDFKPINDHIGVYAEEYILDASVEEFSETPMMEEANERLYGPYLWGRYDLIVLPPSFPFGGMENPRLSFLTPTLVAGDKSLTNVVAHELAHSWSGNLVTNSNWRDAWLNEGFTSYVENRVMEDLYGTERAVMEQALDMESLKRAIDEAERPELTHLKMPEDIEHPDDAFTSVSYIKGANFLFFLEDRFGREHFDPFLKKYFETYAFKSVTTEEFIKYLHDELHSKFPDKLTRAELDAWVYGPGIPDTARKPVSDAFNRVDAQAAAWLAGEKAAADIDTSKWSTHEWLHFLNGLPEGLTTAQFDELDAAFSLTGTQNAETAFAWYMQAINQDYAGVNDALENFLMTVGRGKFIYRLYRGLAETPDRRGWGAEVYERARPGYHPIAQRRIDDIFEETAN